MSKTKEFFKLVGQLIGINLVAFIIIFLLTAGLSASQTCDETNIMIVTIILTQIIYGVFAYWLIKKRKKELGDSYVHNQGLKTDSWKMIFIGLGTAGFGNILINLVMNLMEDHKLVNNSLDLLEKAFTANTPVQHILQFIIACLMAPIIEEYLFRAYVFAESRRAFSLPGAVFVNGLLFGLYHGNFLQAVNTFFFAMVLALVYHYRRNITDAILIHMVNNIVAVGSTYLLAYEQALGIGLTVFIFIGGYFFYRIIKDGKKDLEITEEKGQVS